MSPAEECAERAYDLAERITRIRPLSRTRPHIFLEDKQALAAELRKLAAEMKTLGRLPSRTAPIPRPGTVADRKGRLIRVERRTRAA